SGSPHAAASPASARHPFPAGGYRAGSHHGDAGRRSHTHRSRSGRHRREIRDVSAPAGAIARSTDHPPPPARESTGSCAGAPFSFVTLTATSSPVNATAEPTTPSSTKWFAVRIVATHIRNGIATAKVL